MNASQLQRLATIASLADAGKRGVLESHELPSTFAEIREHAQKVRELPELTGRHKGGVRGFTSYRESWYARHFSQAEQRDEYRIGIYYPDDGGGTTGEFLIRWEDVGDEATPRLEVWGDAWDALTRFPDLIEGLGAMDFEGKEGGATPAQVGALLAACGIRDLTTREDPDRPAPPTHSDPKGALAAFVDRLLPAFDDKTRDEARRLLDAAKGKP